MIGSIDYKTSENSLSVPGRTTPPPTISKDLLVDKGSLSSIARREKIFSEHSAFSKVPLKVKEHAQVLDVIQQMKEGSLTYNESCDMVMACLQKKCLYQENSTLVMLLVNNNTWSSERGVPILKEWVSLPIERSQLIGCLKAFREKGEGFFEEKKVLQEAILQKNSFTSALIEAPLDLMLVNPKLLASSLLSKIANRISSQDQMDILKALALLPWEYGQRFFLGENLLARWQKTNENVFLKKEDLRSLYFSFLLPLQNLVPSSIATRLYLVNNCQVLQEIIEEAVFSDLRLLDPNFLEITLRDWMQFASAENLIVLADHLDRLGCRSEFLFELSLMCLAKVHGNKEKKEDVQNFCRRSLRFLEEFIDMQSLQKKYNLCMHELLKIWIHLYLIDPQGVRIGDRWGCSLKEHRDELVEFLPQVLEECLFKESLSIEEKDVLARRIPLLLQDDPRFFMIITHLLKSLNPQSKAFAFQLCFYYKGDRSNQDFSKWICLQHVFLQSLVEPFEQLVKNIPSFVRVIGNWNVRHGSEQEIQDLTTCIATMAFYFNESDFFSFMQELSNRKDADRLTEEVIAKLSPDLQKKWSDYPLKGQRVVQIED